MPEKSLPPATLQPLMLRMNAIQEGDVLLTRGRGLTSTIIAWLSGGPFSHAALCVKSNVTFESDGGHIGIRVLRYLGLAETATGTAHLLGLRDKPRLCAVYRHQGINRVSPAQFALAVDKIREEIYAKDYPSLSALIRIARLPKRVKQPSARVCDRIYRLSRAKKIPGDFCSQVIARFYAALNLPLFTHEIPAEDVSPNHLARSPFLQRVDQAVVTPAQLTSEFTALPPRPYSPFLDAYEEDPVAALMRVELEARENLKQIRIPPAIGDSTSAESYRSE